MAPLVFFSYGMTKTGSTLAFELVRSALELCGKAQPKLSPNAVIESEKVNFVSHVSEEQASAILSEAKDIGHLIAIKTHTVPDPPLREIFARGQAQGHVIYRDPRDVALSMMDHGARARKRGKLAFSEIETLDDALNGIRNQCDTMLEWLRLPGIRPISYDHVAFDSIRTTREILAELGLKGPARRIVDLAKNGRFTQFNKGKQARYKTEMSIEDANRIKTEFAPLFDHLIHGNTRDFSSVASLREAAA